MQASKTATAGLNAIALPEVLSVFGQRLHCRLLGVDPRLQSQHVLQLRPAVLSDIPERKIANVHPVDDERAGGPKDVGGIVWTELLVLGEDSDTLALDKMAEGGFEEGRGLRRQAYELVLARPPPD